MQQLSAVILGNLDGRPLLYRFYSLPNNEFNNSDQYVLAKGLLLEASHRHLNEAPVWESSFLPGLGMVRLKKHDLMYIALFPPRKNVCFAIEVLQLMYTALGKPQAADLSPAYTSLFSVIDDLMWNLDASWSAISRLDEQGSNEVVQFSTAPPRQPLQAPTQAGLWAMPGPFEVQQAKGVPLQSMHYDITVLDLCSKVKITQKFVNSDADAIEAVFVFPLDEAAVVCRFNKHYFLFLFF